MQLALQLAGEATREVNKVVLTQATLHKFISLQLEPSSDGLLKQYAIRLGAVVRFCTEMSKIILHLVYMYYLFTLSDSCDSDLDPLASTEYREVHRNCIKRAAAHKYL